ncbi:uncharacterized protein PHALS_09004 [Plasmopara halstedii]|uniref:Uncharacterized protein n=1 Tax=Plasmopara halstedii TaxID=4781 RepID=A0A0P1AD76_PLAHL|nr:uncharacterized protein PHALS_09004 [Plasmopara halstedii]CEG38961.1 hypothetical protein PHALS_09004 [Plasmopara halstedii]|eukprot:XP_024575330.1 hypothetical protein PHALS_09004 [Plasmopara halstedii]
MSVLPASIVVFRRGMGAIGGSTGVDCSTEVSESLHASEGLWLSTDGGGMIVGEDEGNDDGG